MESLKTDRVLDAKGMACPMPIVKTKNAMNDLGAGEVIEIQATDKGSKADLQAWAKSAGHLYLGTLEEGDVLKHYLRKSSSDEEIERKHPHVTNNEELEKMITENKDIVVLDVREAAEYAFNHIPNSISIPLGDLEKRLLDLKKEDHIYVVCRTGNRSDLAAQTLTEKGFLHVVNVVPGMSAWSGSTNSLAK